MIMAVKKKTVSKKAPKQLETGELVSADTLKLRAPARRGSMYDSIYDKLAKLKKGQSFVVPVPKDVPIRTLQNRMNAAIRRGPVDAPDGCVFRKHTTVDGKIAILCVDRGVGEEQDKRFAAKKEKLKAKAVAKKSKAPKKAKAA